MKKMLGVTVLVGSLLSIPTAHALVPVTDAAHIAASGIGHATTNGTNVAGWAQRVADFIKETQKWVQEKVHWVKNETELGKTVMELSKANDILQDAYDGATDLRNLGSDSIQAEITAQQGYLPDSYEEGMKFAIGGAGNGVDLSGAFGNLMGHIADAANLTSDQKLEQNQMQSALNRSLAELAYKQASGRRPNLEALADNIDHDAKDLKDTADLQARILAQQALIANEQIKVSSLILLQEAQYRVEKQREKERRLETLSMPDGVIGTAVAAGVAWAM